MIVHMHVCVHVCIHVNDALGSYMYAHLSVLMSVLFSLFFPYYCDQSYHFHWFYFMKCTCCTELTVICNVLPCRLDGIICRNYAASPCLERPKGPGLVSHPQRAGAWISSLKGRVLNLIPRGPGLESHS